MVYREDRSTLPRVSKTPEGYIRGDAIVTRVGVFKYLNADGTVRSELRHPEDVFATDAMASLAMLPITIGHPSAPVTVENAQDLSVGYTGEKARADGNNVLVNLTVTHKRAVDEVGKGKQELSLGYSLDLEEVSGHWDGEPFTHRQRNIRYNHLAIVDVARAGRAARLNMDGAAVLINEEEQAMKKVNLDGVEYEVAPEVARSIDKSNARIDSLETSLKDAQKRVDEASAKADEAKARADEAEKARTVALDSLPGLVKKRVELLSTASKFVNADVSDKSDRDVQIEVIKTKNKDFNGDGKSDDYVAARFDAVVESGAPNPQLLAAVPGTLGKQQFASDAANEQAAWMKSVENLNASRKQ